MSEFVRLTADRDYLLAQGRKATIAAETVNCPQRKYGRNPPPGVVTTAMAAAAAGVTVSAVAFSRQLMRQRPDLFGEVRAMRMTLGQAKYAIGENRKRNVSPPAKRNVSPPAKRNVSPPAKAGPPGAASALALLVRNLATVIEECGGPAQAAALALYHGLSVDGRKVARTYEFLGALEAAMEAGQAA